MSKRHQIQTDINGLPVPSKGFRSFERYHRLHSNKNRISSNEDVKIKHDSNVNLNSRSPFGTIQSSQNMNNDGLTDRSHCKKLIYESHILPDGIEKTEMTYSDKPMSMFNRAVAWFKFTKTKQSYSSVRKTSDGPMTIVGQYDVTLESDAACPHIPPFDMVYIKFSPMIPKASKDDELFPRKFIEPNCDEACISDVIEEPANKEIRSQIEEHQKNKVYLEEQEQLTYHMQKESHGSVNEQNSEETCCTTEQSVADGTIASDTEDGSVESAFVDNYQTEAPEISHAQDDSKSLDTSQLIFNNLPQVQQTKTEDDDTSNAYVNIEEICETQDKGDFISSNCEDNVDLVNETSVEIDLNVENDTNADCENFSVQESDLIQGVSNEQFEKSIENFAVEDQLQTENDIVSESDSEPLVAESNEVVASSDETVSMSLCPPRESDAIIADVDNIFHQDSTENTGSISDSVSDKPAKQICSDQSVLEDASLVENTFHTDPKILEAQNVSKSSDMVSINTIKTEALKSTEMFDSATNLLTCSKTLVTDKKTVLSNTNEFLKTSAKSSVSKSLNNVLSDASAATVDTSNLNICQAKGLDNEEIDNNLRDEININISNIKSQQSKREGILTKPTSKFSQGHSLHQSSEVAFNAGLEFNKCASKFESSTISESDATCNRTDVSNISTLVENTAPSELPVSTSNDELKDGSSVLEPSIKLMQHSQTISDKKTNTASIISTACTKKKKSQSIEKNPILLERPQTDTEMSKTKKNKMHAIPIVDNVSLRDSFKHNKNKFEEGAVRNKEHPHILTASSQDSSVVKSLTGHIPTSTASCNLYLKPETSVPVLLSHRGDRCNLASTAHFKQSASVNDSIITTTETKESKPESNGEADAISGDEERNVKHRMAKWKKEEIDASNFSRDFNITKSDWPTWLMSIDVFDDIGDPIKVRLRKTAAVVKEEPIVNKEVVPVEEVDVSKLSVRERKLLIESRAKAKATVPIVGQSDSNSEGASTEVNKKTEEHRNKVSDLSKKFNQTRSNWFESQLNNYRRFYGR